MMSLLESWEKLVSYNSPCRACSHSHDGLVCSWQVQKTGMISLRPAHPSSDLWGIPESHSHHTADATLISVHPLDLYKTERFEYTQEVDCGCRYYVPSDNLEFLEWKYDESTKRT